VGQVTKPSLSRNASGSTDAGDALKATRPAYFDGSFIESPVYEQELLGLGATVAGPAIIESRLTTIVVPPGYRASVDDYRNVVITAAEKQA
jgi:N-methylhydantoinase A